MSFDTFFSFRLLRSLSLEPYVPVCALVPLPENQPFLIGVLPTIKHSGKQFLLEIGIPIDTQDKEGRTVLHHAAASPGKLKTVSFLRDNGANATLSEHLGSLTIPQLERVIRARPDLAELLSSEQKEEVEKYKSEK